MSLLLFSQTYAAENINLSVPLPGGEQSVSGIAQYVASAFPFFLTVVVGLALVFVVWGGILYASSAGSDRKSRGKNHITNALIGLALAFLAVVILRTINPSIVSLRLPFLDEQGNQDYQVPDNPAWGTLRERDGRICLQNRQCASGFCDFNYITPSESEGTAVNPQGRCAPRAAEIGGTLPTGERCEENDQCRSGFCDTNLDGGRCVANTNGVITAPYPISPKTGSGCGNAPEASCDTNSICVQIFDGSSLCQPFNLRQGAPCNDDRQCAGALRCENPGLQGGTCVAQ